MNENKWAAVGALIGLLAALASVWGLGAVATWDVAWPALLADWRGPSRFVLFLTCVAVPCILGSLLGAFAATEIYRLGDQHD